MTEEKKTNSLRIRMAPSDRALLRRVARAHGDNESLALRLLIREAAQRMESTRNAQ